MPQHKVDLLIKNGIIVTVDKRRRVITNGSIAIKDKRIVAVDKSSKIDSIYSADIEVSASGKIVCPGLIDTHLHLAQALLRGCGEQIDALTWLRDWIWPLQGHFTEKDGKASAELCILEMIRSGTTCFLEVLLHRRYGFNGIANAVKRSGIRGVLAKAIMDTPMFSDKSILHEGMFEDKDESLRATVTHLKEWRRNGDSRVGVWFGPRPVGNCTEETYEEIAELAKQNRTGVTIHHSEVKEQVEYCKEKYGMSPTQFMRRVGLVGDNVVFAHCIHMTNGEIGIMRKTGTNVSHVPSSDMKLAMGVAPVSKMLMTGVNVSLGCNGGANNNTYDLLREASRACLLQRVITHDPMAVSNMQALEMVTINGARALGLEKDIGSLEVGKKADIILVNYMRPHMQPLVDPIAALIHSASGADVETTIADGRILMSNRRVLSMNADSVLHQARESLSDVIDRSGMKKRLMVI